MTSAIRNSTFLITWSIKIYNSICFAGIIYCLLTLPEAKAANPDSLLYLTPQRQYSAIFNTYHTLRQKDTSLLRPFVDELKTFFTSEGTALDLLTLEVTIMQYEHANPNFKTKYLPRALAALQKAEESGNHFLFAKMHQALGMYHYNVQKEYGLAFQYYLKLFDLIKDLNETEYPDYQYTMYIIALAHYDFTDYENAIRYGEVLMNNIQKPITQTHLFNANMVGMAYLRLRNYAAARRYFEWGVPYLASLFSKSKLQKLEKWTGIINGNIGLTYFGEKKYSKALPYLQKGFELSEQTQMWNNSASFGAKLALIALEKGDIKRAQQWAVTTLNHAKKYRDQDRALPNAKFLAEPYFVMSNVKKASGNYRQAMLYADSSAAQELIVKQQMDVTHKHKAEIAVDHEKFNARELLLQKDRERQLLIRNGLLLLLVVFVLVAYLLYKQQHLKQQKLIAQKQLAETELHHSQAQLDQIRQGIQQKNDMIARFTQNWNSANSTPSRDSAEYQLLHELRKSVILTDDDWNSFAELFEKAHPGFFVRLKTKFADLTPAETRFMALARLSYSNREMAAMLGVGVGAVRQYRLRIRRKLEAPEDLDISELASTI